MPLTRRSIGKGAKSKAQEDTKPTSTDEIEDNMKEEETGVVIELKLSEANKPEETADPVAEDKERENEDDGLYEDLLEGDADNDVDNDIQPEEVGAEESKADAKTIDLVTNVEDEDTEKGEETQPLSELPEGKAETEGQGSEAEENLPMRTVGDIAETDAREEKDDNAETNEIVTTEGNIKDESVDTVADLSTLKPEDEKNVVQYEENSELQKESAEVSQERVEHIEEGTDQHGESYEQDEENTEQHDEDVKEVEDELENLHESDKNDIAEMFKNPPFPKSLANLQKLTVTIGPIQQVDLLSSELHEILKMITDFEIKFEGKQKMNAKGTKSLIMKLGYVRTQFKIQKPTYLVKMARLLGSLNIRGRDMSVKFPDVFNRAVEDCQEYLRQNRHIINKNERDKRNYLIELKKRRLVVKNIPENTTEDTMKALFPECLTVSFRMENENNKKICSALLTFENEKTCKECFENNKDVEIGDSKVVMKMLYIPSGNRRGKKKWSQTASGRGRGSAGRGGLQRGSIRGGKAASVGGGTSRTPSTSGVTSPQGKQSMASNMSPRDKRPPVTQPKRRRDSGPKQGPASSRNLGNKAGRLSGNLGNKAGQFQSIQQRVRRRKGTNSRAGGMNARDGGLSARAGGMNARAGGMNARDGGMSARAGGMNARDGGLSARAGGMNPRDGGMNARAGGMNARAGQNIQARNMNQMSLLDMQGGNMMRTNLMGQTQGGNFQAQESRNTGSNEDPMAMMMYLKDTIAKMEEKISQRSSDGARNYSGEGSSPRRGRKRQGGMMNSNRNAKRNRGDNFNMRNQSSGFQSMQQDSYQDDATYYGNDYRQDDYGGGDNYDRNEDYGRNDYGRNSLFGDEGRNRYGGNASFSNDSSMDYGGYRNQGERNNNRERGMRFSGYQGNRNNYNMQSEGGRYGGGMW